MRNKNHKITAKLAAIMLLVSMSMGISPVDAFYNDNEISAGNAFEASVLDISVSGANVSGAMLPGDATTTSVVLSKSNPASLDYQYFASSTIEGDPTACNYISISASSTSNYPTMPLRDFRSAASAPDGSVQWDFTFAMADDVPDTDLGKTCNFKISYIAWQKNLPDSSGGFSDIAEMTGSIEIGRPVPLAPSVVLNEFLPNPGGFEYGFDFGEDGGSMPKGEWVELYNNGDSKINLTGWYVWDDKGENHHKIYIAAANTDLATTTIQSHGWLVVYMNHEVLNNTEDTITLYDSGGAARDSYHYKGRDYLDLEPTPGGENATSTSGSPNLSNVPSNKSYARIPDGTGTWVDPIPTPGEPNKIEENVAPVSGMILNIVAENDLATATPEVIAEPATSAAEVIKTEVAAEPAEESDPEPAILPPEPEKAAEPPPQPEPPATEEPAPSE